MENPLGKLQKIKILHAKRKMQVYAKPVPFKSCSFFKGKYCYSIDMNPFSTSLHTHTNFDCLLRSTVSSTVMVWLIISPAVYYSTTRMGHSWVSLFPFNGLLSCSDFLLMFQRLSLHTSVFPPDSLQHGMGGLWNKSIFSWTSSKGGCQLAAGYFHMLSTISINRYLNTHHSARCEIYSLLLDLIHLITLVLHFVFETGSCCVVQAGLKLAILLSQPPACWDYRAVPPGLATVSS
jgi:hypothetical protein